MHFGEECVENPQIYECDVEGVLSISTTTWATGQTDAFRLRCLLGLPCSASDQIVTSAFGEKPFARKVCVTARGSVAKPPLIRTHPTDSGVRQS